MTLVDLNIRNPSLEGSEEQQEMHWRQLEQEGTPRIAGERRPTYCEKMFVCICALQALRHVLSIERSILHSGNFCDEKSSLFQYTCKTQLKNIPLQQWQNYKAPWINFIKMYKTLLEEATEYY